MKHRNAVILDMDDTLFPESSYVLSGFHAVAKWGDSNLRIPLPDSVAYLNASFERGVRGNAFDLWLEHFGLNPSPDLIRRVVDVYRNHEPEIDPFPDVPSILDNLSKHYPLGLVTDGYLGAQKKKFAALQLAHFFDAVCFTDELGRDYWKPSARPFQIVAKQLSVPTANCVYVGDNPTKDFLGARNAGMCSIRIRLSVGQYANLEPASRQGRPNIEITSHAELEPAIDKWFANKSFRPDE
jgi:putative hydrolase of the HAD superfamily